MTKSRYRPVTRMHNAAACRVSTMTRRHIGVVFKPEVMTHLMSHGCADSSRLRAGVLCTS